jgi:hypothetical protein
MNVARRFASLGSTVLLIGAGAATAFAVNIDTGSVPPSPAVKGLAPYRWWLVAGVSLGAVLLQAVGDGPDSPAGARAQESSRRQHLVSRYVLFAVPWLAGIALTGLALGFRSAWKQPVAA